ncbi:ATP-binding protein [Streptomyces sp. ISL-98]|uniref:ATP-binding protein n=1 Tax=Streptomyces sp. ISL-98 TaxID=2819192 RepID=UPI001BE91738|nr:ATP-binding protein [Streptomyces sp. ISL-98]MBT2510324.1 ATP-binding protein [Streptomyces sp. ISL-98]
MAMRLEGDVSEVQRARRDVSRVLAAWRIPRAIDDALLVANELVANALVHTGGDGIELVATYGDGLLLVEVRDASDEPPSPVADAGLDVCGRGLAMVHALSSDWGWTRRAEGGKSTWALLAVRRAESPKRRVEPREGCS